MNRTTVIFDSDLRSWDDIALTEAVKAGNETALEVLLHRYQRYARTKARNYFLVGADSDDIYQEGMIGLFKAVRDFRPDRQSSFRAFAELCITRQIITAIKTATRRKHQPLNMYVSFSSPRLTDEATDRTYEDFLEAEESLDPANQVVSSEEMDRLRGSLTGILSPLEREVLRLYVEGASYQDIASQLERRPKSIDNAIQRIKRKLEAHLRRQAAEDRMREETSLAI
ncbi:MAG: RNA polymerase sporulation sigma factor SigH [Acidimicrobiia bacterium]|nr:RNA polymerase sporulation sigma factor SigH [Acidimicrobiia bacterium]